MPSFYIIDAHAYLHRAYHALPPLTNSKGEPVNAIYGFLRMLLKIMRQYKPDAMAVCFDHSAPTFRHESFAEYKATRKETDSALIAQFPIAREATAALGLAQFELAGYEADDLIAHLARRARDRDWEVVVVSGDKDILQLVADGIKVLNEPKDVIFDAAKVVEKWGVSPTQLPDILALMGDTSDNIPGVPGIGEKTAVKLIQEHGSLEALLAAAPNVKGKTGQLLQEHAELARKSRALVVLNQDLPIEVDWDACMIVPPKSEVLIPFLQRMEFYALMKDLVPPEVKPVDTSARDYQTLTDDKALAAWVKVARNADRLAVDVETDGLDPSRDRLVGISMSTHAGSACYIPVGHQLLDSGHQLSIDMIQKHLRPLFNGEKPKLYGHNLKFDSMVLKRHGMPLGPLTCDTMVASYVLNPSRNSHGLKDLVLEWVGERMTSIETLIGKGAQQITMDQVPVDQASAYACADADMTLRLADKLEALINEKELSKLFYEMEMPLVNVLQSMEEVGIRVDARYLSVLGDQLKTRVQALEKEIFAHAGETFNIGSPKQLAVILFEKLQLPVIRRTKTGISTDEEVLKKLADKHPLPKSLMEYRELQKLYSTYVVALQEAMHPENARVRTSFNQTVAATGRLSSSNPNLQNIPIRTEVGRQIRKAFIPADGHVLLSADYSQIDLRMLAHISGDPVLVKAFQSGEDVHTTTASEIFGVKPAEVNSDLRRVAKSINFGIVYGISAFGLSQQLQIPADEAKDHIQRYFDRYPGVRAWIDRTLEEARKDGFVRTLLGRIRYLPEITSKNIQMRNFAERTAMNTPIQGTSADVIKLAMIQLARAKERDEWAGEMLLQVHDELVFEVPNDAVAATKLVIKRLMETVLELSIPIVVDLKAGPNWAEMTPIKEPQPL
jgi:DNA polymerase-1